MVTRDGNTLALSGPVNAYSYSSLRDAAAPYVGGTDLVVDWSQVSAVDSSAVALILTWQRASIANNVTVTCVGVPPSLRSLLELYNLGELVDEPC